MTSAPIPLWKLEIDDEEYEKLKAEIRQAAGNGFKNCGEECALFYAESWRREYSGGVISKEMIARFADIFSCQRSDDLFNSAKAALTSLQIPIIQLNVRHYFRTLLLQGGLPISRLMQNQTGFDAFQRFLKGLIASFSRLDVDWDDVENVENLNCVRYLPKSYRNNCIYAVSLQIIRAVVEEKEELLPYKATTKELKELTDSLKKENVRVKNLVIRHPLTIDWNLEIQELDNQKSCGVLRYELREIKTITSDMVKGLNSTDCFQFDLFLSRQYIATYKRVKEEEWRTVYKRISLNSRKFTWKGECSVEVKLVCDSGEDLFPSVVNGCAPNLEYPQLLFKNEKGVHEFQKDAGTTTCVALFSQDYVLEQCETPKDIFVNGMRYRYENIGTAESIVCLNSSGERIELKNESSDYSAVYGIDYLSWIESSNYAVTSKPPKIRVYDGNENLAKNAKIEFRQRNGNWQKYTEKNLPFGLVEFKVEFPDGKLERKSFYCIDNLTFRAENATPDSAEIICTGSVSCSVFPVLSSEINFNEVSLSKKWILKKIGTRPSVCHFEIHASPNPVLKISIPSPFEGLSLVKNDNEPVLANAILSFNEFAKYRVLCAGKKTEYDVNISCGEYAIHQTIKNGITALSSFEDSINRVWELSGENPFLGSSCVNLAFEGKSYRVRYFSLDSCLTGQRKSIEIIDNGWVAVRSNIKVSFWNGGTSGCMVLTGNLQACKLLEPKDDAMPAVIPLEHMDIGSFRFPAGTPDGEYLVFSDVYDDCRIIPKLYCLRNGYLEEEQGSRLGNSNNDIQNWILTLDTSEVLDDKSWGKIPLYMEIAERWNLPFKSFNSISASVSSPKLLAKLLLRLFMDEKMNELSSAILRMEREYAMAIHWNRNKIFNDVFSAVAENYPSQAWREVSGGFLKSVKNLLSLSLDSSLAELIQRFLAGNLQNKNPDRLSNEEISNYRGMAMGKNPENSKSELPSIDLPLNKPYYTQAENILPYQKTMINSPLYVYEYTQGINDTLWNSDPDSMKLRRVICFYQRYFKFVYYEILTKMLQ